MSDLNSFNLGNIGSAFSILCCLKNMYDTLKEKRDRGGLEKRLGEEIAPDIKNVEVSFDHLLLNLYTVVGAHKVGFILYPQDTNSTVEEIVTNFEDSVYEFENNFKKLLQQIKTHEDSYKEVFNKNPDKRILLDSLLASLNPETNNINWDKLPKVKLDINKKSDFPNELNEKFCVLFNDIQQIKIQNSSNLGELIRYDFFQGIGVSKEEFLGLLRNPNFINDFGLLLKKYKLKGYKRLLFRRKKTVLFMRR